MNQENGDLTYDSGEMADILNKHYASVFTTEDPNLPPSPPPATCPVMPNIYFSEYGVSEVLRRLKNSSSPGPDEVSQRVLKEE